MDLTGIKDFSFAESIFTRENKFDNEDIFVNDIISKLPDIIKNMYNLDIDQIFRERWILLKEHGYINIRADIYIKTKQGIDIIIECKNPTHDKAETFNALGQMIAYELNLDAMNIDYKLILATSVFDFNILRAIVKHSFNFDLILHNKLTSAFAMHNEL